MKILLEITVTMKNANVKSVVMSDKAAFFNHSAIAFFVMLIIAIKLINLKFKE